eukprot:7575978-Karenia_brevis.AAC.1
MAELRRLAKLRSQRVDARSSADPEQVLRREFSCVLMLSNAEILLAAAPTLGGPRRCHARPAEVAPL